MLTGESRFHRSTPQWIWTWVPCDGKQTGSPLDQWDMVRMKWDCRLSTGLPPQQPTPCCEAVRKTCSERETGTGKLCEIKWDYHIVGTATHINMLGPAEWSLTGDRIMNKKPHARFGFQVNGKISAQTRGESGGVAPCTSPRTLMHS